MSSLFRKVIRITAEDSPNVIYARKFIEKGLPAPEEDIIPGLLGYREYQKRLATWDDIRQCIGLRGEFYKGSELLMFPPVWLNQCEERYEFIKGRKRIARGLGIDPAEGGASTALSVVDEYGILMLEAFKTPDTSIIAGHIAYRMREFSLEPSRVCIDRGGGGKQIADQLKSTTGIDIRSVGFGESAMPEPDYLPASREEKIDDREERYTYFNKRAMLYGELRELIKPIPDTYHVSGLPYIWDNLKKQFNLKVFGWSIPPGSIYQELRRQLAPLPILYSNEGRLRLPPKNRKSTNTNNQGEKTLIDILGCSPDEADATVLAVHAMLHPDERPTIGMLFRNNK